MDFINLFGFVLPDSGFWPMVLGWFNVGNFAWTVIILTIVLKLILSPFDFLQRKSTIKMNEINLVLQPQMQKLEKQYGSNKQILQQKQAELMKKNGFSMGSTCVVMLLYLVLSTAIFMTFFFSLQSISQYNIKAQYETLKTEYLTTIDSEKNWAELSYEQIVENINLASEDLKATANENVVAKYEEIKDSWLWVKNIWRKDTTESTIPSFDEYVNGSKITFEEGEKDLANQEYDMIMGGLKDNYGGNGYYILVILVVGVSFLSQLLIRQMSKPKVKRDSYGREISDEQAQKTASGTNKVMLILMPVLMLSFSISSCAGFAVYILSNTLMTAILTPLITLIVNKTEQIKKQKEEQNLVADYRRK